MLVVCIIKCNPCWTDWYAANHQNKYTSHERISRRVKGLTDSKKVNKCEIELQQSESQQISWLILSNHNKYQCTIHQELTAKCRQMLCVYSPGGSTLLCETTSRPPSWKSDIKSKIRLRQSMRILRGEQSCQISSRKVPKSSLNRW